MFLVFEHLEFLLECPDTWGHFPGADAFEDFLDGLRCLIAVFELLLDFVLLVAILGFLFGFFCFVFFEDLLVVLMQLGFGWVECVVGEELFKCGFSKSRVKLSKFLEAFVLPGIDFVFSLLDTALDARKSCTDCGDFGDFLEVVGVLVDCGVGTVHEGGDLDELLDPLVDGTEDRGVVVCVLRAELVVEA